MNIVIISNVIYPRISPRSFRATELAKCFAKKGHNVSLFAVLGEYNYFDFEESTGISVHSLGRMFFPVVNSDGYARNSFVDRVLRRLFGRALEFPDIELMWKTSKVVRKLKDVDLLITIAVPYPIHWGAAIAKKRSPKSFPKVWVSDCGDPFMGDSVNTKHPSYFNILENFWGNNTNYITVPIEEAKAAYSPNVLHKIKVIPQGFDFSSIRIDKDFHGNDIMRFAYAGNIFPGYRDPSQFLDFLCTLKEKPFEFVVYTKNPAFFDIYKKQLGEKLDVKGYIPRNQLLWELSQMDFLINIKNNSGVQAPSKLIDYYLTERPILDISSVFEEDSAFIEFINRDYSHQHIKVDISQYKIENVCDEFLALAINNN